MFILHTGIGECVHMMDMIRTQMHWMSAPCAVITFTCSMSIDGILSIDSLMYFYAAGSITYRFIGSRPRGNKEARNQRMKERSKKAREQASKTAEK